MKRLLLLLLLTGSSISIFAQQATVKLKILNAKERTVKVLLPVDGKIFWAARTEKQLDKNNSLTETFVVDKIGYLNVVSNQQSFGFYIAPGTTEISLDLDKKGGDRIDYRGANKAGQLLAINNPRPFYQEKARGYSKLDSTAVGIGKLIQADQKKDMADFQKLLDEKQISQAFFDFQKRNIEGYYLAVETHIPLVSYIGSKRANKSFKEEYAKWWSSLVQKHPFTSVEDINTFTFYDNALSYVQGYSNGYLKSLTQTEVTKPAYDSNEFLDENYRSISKLFQGPIREYMLASFIHVETIQERYQSGLLGLFQNFKKTYPTSKYSSYLATELKAVEAYQAAKLKNFTAEQKLIENYEAVNSLDELAAKFKGKTVFVDIWATWCGPCKAEFEYEKELDKFLKSKGVAMLFISMDEESATAQWKEMIKFYNLSGSHILVNKTLKQDLINKLWEGKGYSIPRYLIFKDGAMIVSKALRPSGKEELYEQIGKYL